MSEVTVQKLENQNSRHNFEDSLQKAINISGINVSKKPTDKEIRYMQMYVTGQLTHAELKLAISRFGEKTACMIFSNGNLSEFIELQRDLKSIAEDEEKAEHECRLPSGCAS